MDTFGALGPPGPHHGYLLMHFRSGRHAPTLERVGVFSEAEPSRMGGDFYAELRRSEGRTFHEARLNVLQGAARDPAMEWIRNFLPEHDRAEFDRAASAHRQLVAQMLAQSRAAGPAYR